MNFGKVRHFLDNKTFYIPRKLYCRYCKTFYLHSKKVSLCTVLWIQWNLYLHSKKIPLHPPWSLLSTFQENSTVCTVCLLNAESWVDWYINEKSCRIIQIVIQDNADSLTEILKKSRLSIGIHFIQNIIDWL